MTRAGLRFAPEPSENGKETAITFPFLNFSRDFSKLRLPPDSAKLD
jgi:hypothetical protein